MPGQLPECPPAPTNQAQGGLECSPIPMRTWQLHNTPFVQKSDFFMGFLPLFSWHMSRVPVSGQGHCREEFLPERCWTWGLPAQSDTLSRVCRSPAAPGFAAGTGITQDAGDLTSELSIPSAPEASPRPAVSPLSQPPAAQLCRVLRGNHCR